MRFVQDHVIPRLPLENVCITASERIRRHADVEVILVIPPLSKLLPTFGIPVIAEHLETRKKLLELHLPVQQNARWNDDQMRAPDTAIAGQMGEQGNSLNGFPVSKSK